MYPYTQNTGSLTSLIRAIGKHGVPDKFTSKDLPVWGYKSSNDRPIAQILKFIGFLDQAGSPTELWKEARVNPEKATANGVRRGYKDLFQMFPDAHRKDAESLTNFFKAKTTVGDAAVKMMVSTFRSLAQLGDFDSDDTGNHVDNGPVDAHDVPDPSKAVTSLIAPNGNGMTINLNIELSLPADAQGDVYDAFFKSMKKHLIDVDDRR